MEESKQVEPASGLGTPSVAEVSPGGRPDVMEASGPRPAPVPDVIHPRCPHCGADPLKIWRLRYDFPDGVVAEVLFCGGNEKTKADCRAVLNATIVGFQQARPAAAKP